MADGALRASQGRADQSKGDREVAFAYRDHDHYYVAHAAVIALAAEDDIRGGH